MKLIIPIAFVAAMLAALCSNSQAQPAPHYIIKPLPPKAAEVLSQQMADSRSASKVAQVHERLVAVNYYSNSYHDSLHYYYNSTRGSDLNIISGAGYKYDLDPHTANLTGTMGMYQDVQKRYIMCDSLHEWIAQTGSSNYEHLCSFSYNSNNQILNEFGMHLSYPYNVTSTTQDTFYYTTNGLLTETRSYATDTTGGNLNIESWRSYHFHDFQGFLLMDSMVMLEGNNWVPQTKISYFNTGFGKQDSNITYSFNNGTWQAIMVNHFTYDAGNRLVSYSSVAGSGSAGITTLDSFVYASSATMPVARYETYIADGDTGNSRELIYSSSPSIIDSSMVQSYNDTLGQWEPYNSMRTTYNSLGHAVEEHYLYHDGTQCGYHWYYENYDDGITEAIADVSTRVQCRIYPNPTSNLLYIVPVGNLKGTLLTACLYNTTGQIVLRRQLVASLASGAALSLDGLGTGIYQLCITSSNGNKQTLAVQKN